MRRKRLGQTELNTLTKTIIRNFEERLRTLRLEPLVEHVGRVLTVGDGVAILAGLRDVAYSELVEFPSGAYGLCVNLEADRVGAIVLGDYLTIKEGDEVRATGRLISTPVGQELIGRVITPLGDAVDGRGSLKLKKFYPLEKIAPGVTLRRPVNTPLQTGIKAIDSMIPVGRGQRELIIGDRGTGKTALALDTIINQREENVICIYVAIGQKQMRIAQVVDQLERHDALKHTIVVTASASQPASLQYLAPYAGSAIGEYFMDQGKDVLVVYDDLSKHAWAYRQISLVLRRPSGREAYPGDIFYLHSRLLERACRLDDRLGGGSLTALPIIETLAGDLSAYIPTNIISITDGQIYLESDLFNAGIRPAVNVGLSVSRVGGAAQVKAMKQVTGPLRLDLAQYRALAAFVQFASDLDPDTKARIDRGSRMVEILKQPQFRPYPVEEQVAIFWAASHGYLDNLPVESISAFEQTYLDYLRLHEKKLLQTIKKERKITEDVTEKLKKASEKVAENFAIV